MIRKDTDEIWMAKALRLAERGRGSVNPNPMVGAVLVKGGKQIAEGFHASYGGPHAEVQALTKAGTRAKGTTLYVTLEPCTSWGKTPPCTEAILQSGIKRMVVASGDRNPANRKKGVTLLRKHGIEITEGILKNQAEELNRGFFTWVTEKRPFVTLKMAQSLDGKIAASTGESRWITGEKARAHVQELRSTHDAVLVGFNTALLDDPSLTVRSGKGASARPWRVILDPRDAISSGSKVFRGGPVTIRAVAKAAAQKRRAQKSSKTSEVLLVCKTSREGRIDLKDLLEKLGECGVTSLLVEGGGETAWSFIREGLADRLLMFLAPKIIGGRNAKTSVEGKGIGSLDKAFRLKNVKASFIGEDLLVEGEF